MSKIINLRIDHLEGISRQKKVRVDERFRAALRRLPLDVKETALDALGAVFRGDALTDEQQNALDQCEAVGYFNAPRDRKRTSRHHGVSAADERWRGLA